MKPSRREILKVLLTPEEKRGIAAAARACGLSMSAYARNLALGQRPPGPDERSDLQGIFRLHADLGRLGGLLKMFLTNRERVEDLGRDFALATIDGTLVDIRVAQARLRERLEQSLGRRKGGETP